MTPTSCGSPIGARMGSRALTRPLRPSWCGRIRRRTRTYAKYSAATARSGAPCLGRTSWSSLDPRGNRDLGTEVLKETKRGVPTGVVDERGRHLVPLVGTGRPVRVEPDAQAAELHLAVDARFELPRPSALAFAGGGAAVHVARTPVVAVARDDEGSLHVPRGRLCLSHSLAPSLHIGPPTDIASSGRARTTTAATTSNAPAIRPNATPSGRTFSTRTTTAIPAAQTRLIAPTPTKSDISAQQQPRQ